MLSIKVHNDMMLRKEWHGINKNKNQPIAKNDSITNGKPRTLNCENLTILIWEIIVINGKQC